MGTGRKYNKKPVTRPKKSTCAKKRRVTVQKKRLVSLGLDATKVSKMTTKDIRTKLRHPKKTAAAAGK